MSHIREFLEVNGSEGDRVFIPIEDIYSFSTRNYEDRTHLQIGEFFIDVTKEESDRVIDILKDRFSVS